WSPPSNTPRTTRTTTASTPTSSGHSCNTATDETGDLPCSQAAESTMDRVASLLVTPAEGCFDDSIFAEPATGARSARLQPAGPGGDKRCGSGEPRRHATHAEPAYRQELPDAGYRNAGGGRRRPARPEHRRPRNQQPAAARIRTDRADTRRAERGQRNLAALPRSCADQPQHGACAAGSAAQRTGPGAERKAGEADRATYRQPGGPTGQPQRPPAHAQPAHRQTVP